VGTSALDVAVAFWDDPERTIRVWPGVGDGTFDAPIDSTLPNGFSSGRAVDIDGDGYDDLLGGGLVSLANGDGTFSVVATGVIDACVTAYPAWRAPAVDYDGDGIRDILAQTYDSCEGESGFGIVTGPDFDTLDYATDQDGYRLITGDFDADGVTDVFDDWTGSGDAVLTRESLGDGTLEVTGQVSVDQGGYTGMFYDLDGDGDLDLVRTTTSAHVEIWRNDP
jgi:hypothetical protein